MPPREATPAHHPRGNAARRYPHGAATAFPAAPAHSTRGPGGDHNRTDDSPGVGRGRMSMRTAAELVGLLRAVAGGDQAAFEALYAATRAKLYGVVLRILRRADLADEVMQEAYLKIWNSAGQFDPALAGPITWMVAIARNRAIDVARRKRDVSVEEAPEVLERAADIPDPLAGRERSEELRRLLITLAGST